MKYLIIMWILCLFITGRHIYLHRPQPVAQKVVDPPKVAFTTTEGSHATGITTTGGNGGEMTMTAGSGGTSCVADGNGRLLSCDPVVVDRLAKAKYKEMKRKRR